MNTRIWIVFMMGMLTAGGIGYSQGKAVTAGHYERILSEEREGRHLEERQRLEAIVQAERDARQRFEAESARVASLAGQLKKAHRQLADERQTFNRRLADVSQTASDTCRGLPSEWVRLYNSAASPLDTSHRTRNPAHTPTRNTDITNTARSAGTGIQSDALLTPPEDILAHVRDYGEYCRTVEAQRDTLVRLVTP